MQVYLLIGCDLVCLLEIKRGKGDLLEFHAAYSSLVEDKLASLINRPKSDGEAKSESS